MSDRRSRAFVVILCALVPAVAAAKPKTTASPSPQASASPGPVGTRGASMLDGGWPIVIDGKIVGGIGVSGVTGAQDAQIGKAGVDTLK